MLCRDRPRAVCRARASVAHSSQLLRSRALASVAVGAASRHCLCSTPDSRQGRVSPPVLYLQFEQLPAGPRDRLGADCSWGNV
ncbi:hypothetical protein NDU88_002484 [Pleurodeles waltl]|uniref:Secreted protein n=1 Tax=Pleurodeles waltl TaxID=8319 RepID=A0AAV7MMT1_PLEWA|nr:hypothetical protein NDU88_002484 [Pleurodeles waltl]